MDSDPVMAKDTNDIKRSFTNIEAVYSTTADTAFLFFLQLKIELDAF